MSDSAPRFEFGRNWNDFLEKHYSEERVQIAQKHLLDFLGVEDLRGKSFVDIGCGSGIHSLAAYRSGVERLFSFDYDPNSVETTRMLWEREGSPENWKVCQGSVLDEEFMLGIEKPDIVYSWGVLHHTGQMWNAITNAAKLLRKDSLFYIALYTTTNKSPYWIETKQKYQRSSATGKRWMEFKYVARHRLLIDLIKLQNPLRKLREYREKRGMDYMTDVRDWLGGWPYEDAKVEEILAFGRDSLNLELLKLATGEANTEYLFRPQSSQA